VPMFVAKFNGAKKDEKLKCHVAYAPSEDRSAAHSTPRGGNRGSISTATTTQAVTQEMCGVRTVCAGASSFSTSVARLKARPVRRQRPPFETQHDQSFQLILPGLSINLRNEDVVLNAWLQLH
jgi:hypothetical protein